MPSRVGWTFLQGKSKRERHEMHAACTMLQVCRVMDVMDGTAATTRGVWLSVADANKEQRPVAFFQGLSRNGPNCVQTP